LGVEVSARVRSFLSSRIIFHLQRIFFWSGRRRAAKQAERGAQWRHGRALGGFGGDTERSFFLLF
jgi:hypothetical protein